MTPREKIEKRIPEIRAHIKIMEEALEALRADVEAGDPGPHVAEIYAEPMRLVLRRERCELKGLELSLVAQTVADGTRVADLLIEADALSLQAHELLGMVEAPVGGPH